MWNRHCAPRRSLDQPTAQGGFADDDCLRAFGAGRHQTDFHADLFRKKLDVARARSRGRSLISVMPSVELFQPGSVSYTGSTRRRSCETEGRDSQFSAIELVADTDFDFIQRVEHVEFRQGH